MTGSTSTYQMWRRLAGVPGGTRMFSAAAMARVPYFASVLPHVVRMEPGLAEVLGVISLKRMDEGKFNRDQSEIGYWVAPAFWNTGFASEAVRALVMANPQGNRTIFAEVFQDNPGSARVLTNAGFQYLGDAETFSVARNSRVPTWTYIRKLG